jgi:hypothetical protein
MDAETGCRSRSSRHCTSNGCGRKPNNQERNMATFSAKRKAPKHVAPLSLNGVRYEAVLDTDELGYGGRGGVIAAYDDRTGELVWHVRIYRTEYNPTFEQDAQETYITSISAIGGGEVLLVTDERQRRFRLDLADRSVKVLE